MKLPTLEGYATTKYTMSTFGGYNHTNNASESEFFDMKNMSSRSYPALSNRLVRGNLSHSGYGASITDYSKVRLHNYSFAGSGSLLWSNNGNVMDGALPIINLTDTRNVVELGAHIVANSYSGMKEFNRATSRGKDLSYKFSANGNYFMYVVPFIKSGNDITVPDNAEFLSLPSTTWNATTKVMTHIDKKYGGTNNERSNIKPDGTLSYNWTDSEFESHEEGIASSYCGILIVNKTTQEVVDLSSEFTEREVLTVSGGVSTDKIEGAYTIQGFSSGWTLVTRFGKCIREDGNFVIERKIPNMECLIECDNRLWGATADGREIYATQQGQPERWQVFTGDDSASVALTTGTNGKFTGGCVISGRPVFFKERHTHVVSGSLPSNYSITRIETMGVKTECERSLCVINNVAYYVGADGIYVSNGGAATCISTQFGKIFPQRAVGCGFENKYYVCITSNGVSRLYVYDTLNGMWHIEDCEEITSMVTSDKDVFFCTNTAIYSVNGNAVSPFESTLENTVEWYAESAPIGYTWGNAKYLNNIVLRLTLSENAMVNISVQYDSNQEWDDLVTLVGDGITRQYTVPIVPRRCDTFKYKIEGNGDFMLLSITKNLREGSGVWL